jgi:hypothetical protein
VRFSIFRLDASRDGMTLAAAEDGEDSEGCSPGWRVPAVVDVARDAHERVHAPAPCKHGAWRVLLNGRGGVLFGEAGATGNVSDEQVIEASRDPGGAWAERAITPLGYRLER